MTKLQQQTACMVDYFRAGCKPEDAPLTLGLEVEHFLVHKDGAPVTFEQVQAILHAMQRPGDTELQVDGLYMGYANKLFSVTLEPACQLEFSIAPKESIVDMMTIYKAARQQLRVVATPMGIRVYNQGYHPTRKVSELPLIPKMRYRIMDAWFRQTGKHGVHMMRATASTQLSIDYTSEQDFVRKYRVACLLAPLLALLTDNSPVYQGQPNKIFSVRTAIWNDVDPARCGALANLFAPDFGFEAYARAVLQAPLVVLRRNGASQPSGAATAEQLYGPELRRDQIEHILSMFFFDARLKNYLELRVADSMPTLFMEAYAQLIKTVFGSPVLLVGILQRYKGVSLGDIQRAKMNVCAKGYGAQVYGRPVAGELAWLLTMAKSRGVKQEGRERLEPLTKLVSAQVTIKEVTAHA